jgi:hypothetical protein
MISVPGITRDIHDFFDKKQGVFSSHHYFWEESPFCLHMVTAGKPGRE